MFRFHAKGGYVALLSVLIVAAIAASTIIVLFVTSLSTTINSGNIGSSRMARVLADACAERALLSLTVNALIPPQTISDFDEGECAIVSINSLGGNNWEVHTTGSINNPIGSVVKFIEITALKPGLGQAAVVTSWKECLQFPCL
jgi:hypothetical protein